MAVTAAPGGCPLLSIIFFRKNHGFFLGSVSIGISLLRIIRYGPSVGSQTIRYNMDQLESKRYDRRFEMAANALKEAAPGQFFTVRNRL